MGLILESVIQKLESWPGVTYGMQWGEHLLFKVEGKMFAILSLEDVKVTGFSFKVNSEEHFDELTAQDGITRMSHSQGKNWVHVAPHAGISQPVALNWLRGSYVKIRSGLPKKTIAQLEAAEQEMNRSL
jgi:predicted DNA-binding protein (MmcQ/YjbR family)